MPRAVGVLRHSGYDPSVPSYTVAQASVLTGVPAKLINQYLDRELACLMTVGAGFRAVKKEGLFCLRLNYDLHRTLTLDCRRQVIELAMENPRGKSISIEDGACVVRIDVARTTVANGLSKWRQCKEMVVENDEVMSGEPCLKGTRLSVYVVSDLLNACGRDEVLDAYPDVTAREIDAAVMYSEMFPRKGRPRSVGARLQKAKPKRKRSVRVKLPA